MQRGEDIIFVLEIRLANVDLGLAHANLVYSLSGESLGESREQMVSPVVFTSSHLLFHNSGLLELIVNRFGSVTIYSEQMGGSSDRVSLPDCFKELLPHGITDDCIDLVYALSRL